MPPAVAMPPADQWEGVMARSGTYVATDLDVNKDEDWHTFEIRLSADGLSAEFFIDGVLRGTANWTGDPGTTNPTGLLPLQIVRNPGSGTGTKSAEIDYYKYQFRPTTLGQMYPE